MWKGFPILLSSIMWGATCKTNLSIMADHMYGQGKLTRYWSKETKPDKETHSHPNSRETEQETEKYLLKESTITCLSYCTHYGLTSFLQVNPCVFTSWNINYLPFVIYFKKLVHKEEKNSKRQTPSNTISTWCNTFRWPSPLPLGYC